MKSIWLDYYGHLKHQLCDAMDKNIIFFQLKNL